jgi:hypothetical protein
VHQQIATARRLKRPSICTWQRSSPYRHAVADHRAAVSGDVSHPAGRILELIGLAQTKNAAQNGRRTM